MEVSSFIQLLITKATYFLFEFAPKIIGAILFFWLGLKIIKTIMKAGSQRISKTVLRSLDHRTIYIPNGKFAGETIENYSHEKLKRVDLDFSISNREDLERAKEYISNSLEKVSGVDLNSKIKIVVSDLSEFSIKLQAILFCRPCDYFSVKTNSQNALLETMKNFQVLTPMARQGIYSLSSGN